MTVRPRRQLGEFLGSVAAPIAEMVDRRFGWDKLTERVGVAALLGIRHRLRVRNLYDTRRVKRPPGEAPALPDERSGARTLDGRCNDPTDPDMGAVRTPFGRNAPPLADTEEPSALKVSEALLKRHEFFPAETLNLLAAAWVQFEVHDWFVHLTHDYSDKYVDEFGDGKKLGEPKSLVTDTNADPDHPPFVSDQTHWWDASQLYGAQDAFAKAIREGDEGRVLEDLELLKRMEPFAKGGDGKAAAAPNLWLGTALFHVLFAKEHNAICAMLKERHPAWDDRRLFDKARLINSAVMAKIHTVEWTPAIVAHPATKRGARKTWEGIVSPKWRPALKRCRDEVLTGIPGSRLSHDRAPYALTEEFVAVYRMHQLIPDKVAFVRRRDGSPIDELDIHELTVEHDKPERPRTALKGIGLEDAFYSLAIQHPGEITLHNHPKFMRHYRPADGQGVALDLGMVDILRTRQTCVPRYNDFRRLFRLEPAADFHEIANGNPKWAKEIREVYDNKLEAVDLLIGMYAERKPKGFAFSDTAFRVFLLMAARRLRSDRFFTTDYTPEVYTPEGMKWIEDATLSRILRRHVPELAPALEQVKDNVFAPWPPRAAS
jgi:Animal haem peroxidase